MNIIHTHYTIYIITRKTLFIIYIIYYIHTIYITHIHYTIYISHHELQNLHFKEISKIDRCYHKVRIRFTHQNQYTCYVDSAGICLYFYLLILFPLLLLIFPSVALSPSPSLLYRYLPNSFLLLPLL